MSTDGETETLTGDPSASDGLYDLVLPLASPDALLGRVGGKGASLARLATAGLPVPDGFHITTAAYRRFVAANDLQARILAAVAGLSATDPAALEQASSTVAALFEGGTVPDDIAAAVAEAYAALEGDDGPVAVRSSATAEDLPGMSFAGQQETYLNISGTAAVLEAVKRCWASLWTARAIGYRARNGIAPESVSLAVVVQRLVPAEAAGILFTADPVTGARAQAHIDAGWGLGEALVGGLVTPDHYVVDTTAGAMLSTTIADKAVMVAPTAQGTAELPVPEARRHAAVLRPEQVLALAALGARIEALYGMPMDIEWALAEGDVKILQARPITALPVPPATVERVTLDWSIPRPGGRYARSSVIELLPEPLSPLFETMGLPAWNRAMGRLMSGIGLGGVMPDAMLMTINDYAFYDFGMTARQGLGFVAHTPLLLVRAGPWLTRSRERWEAAAAAYRATVKEWSAVPPAAKTASGLLAGVQAVVEAAAQHYLAIQSGILPVAYMSEAAFISLYDRLARREGDPPALTFVLGYDSTPIRAEKDLYDLATWARGEPELAAWLAATPGSEIADRVASSDELPEAGPAWPEFRRRFAAHLEAFGHTIYDLDFARPVPVEEPAPIIEALRFFLGGAATNPHERQAAAAAAREAATAELLARLGPARRKLLRGRLATAQRYAPLREDALAAVGLGWPLVRERLAELGRRLVAAGAVEAPADVYLLTAAELAADAAGLDAGMSLADHRETVAERRSRRERERQVSPPVTLPPKEGSKFLGFDFSNFMPAREAESQGDVLHGIGASPGRVTGEARVIRGPAEFAEMRPGDILVAPITTPAWTPLFALAAGVVTDVGGPLSHSSIVAREYGVPAVLGTGVATSRLTSGERITVDGDAGTVAKG